MLAPPMPQPVLAQLYLADRQPPQPLPDGGQHRPILAAATHGPVLRFGEVALPPGGLFTAHPDAPIRLWLLPLLGGLELHPETTPNDPDFLVAGQAGTLPVGAGETCTILNPYPTEIVSFLYVWLPANAPATPTPFTHIDIDLTTRNTLQPVCHAPDVQAYVGRYDGRAEGTYLARQWAFVGVLAGVFEVADRLLHPGDYLRLNYAQSTDVEFEALSNQATLLLFG